MSDALIFAFGSVVFIASSWATLSFGLSRMQELALSDVEQSERFSHVERGTYADVYVSKPVDEDRGDRRVREDAVPGTGS